MKVGDRVKVKEKKSSGDFDTFTEYMEEHCGCTYTVTHDYEDGFFRLDDVNGFHWHHTWLDKIAN